MRRSTLHLLALGGLLLAGCGKPAAPGSGVEPAPEPPAVAEGGSTESVPASAAADLPEMSEPGVEAVPEPPVPVTPVPEAPTTEAAPVAAPEAAAGKKVVLGDPSLTAGIPGEGALTVEQIKAWLATPGVLEPLEFELPLGLSLGSGNIKGIEENPLTRAKIELGRQLYFDTRLSSDNTVSCASCHAPDQGYAAHTRFGVGVNQQEGGRNSPVSFNRILSAAQFWDGRAETLEAQAVGPIANPIEMANTHDQAVKTVSEIEGYRLQFEAVFGPDSVNIDNIGKALATFERALVTSPAPFDYYAVLEPFLNEYADEEAINELKADDAELYARFMQLKADSAAHPISESAIRGKQLFFTEKGNCTTCHAGANFTDELYHNLGVGMDAAEPDLGRFVITNEDKDRGAFKTPTIRNVALSAPYMHDGSQKTLLEVVEWYAKGGHPNEHLSPKMKKLELTDQDKADLVAFMEACTGEFPKVEPGRLP